MSTKTPPFSYSAYLIKGGDFKARILPWLGRLHNQLVFGRRAQVLRRHLADLIPPHATVLDVGCGNGWIDRLILESRPDISVYGIDILVRDNVHIPAHRYDGKRFPYPDKTFDTVIFVDVLHHTRDPIVLLKEACRVGRKSIIIKDHNCSGFAAGTILHFMDWLGNAPYGIVLTYNYWSQRQWQSAFNELGLALREYRAQLRLYPPPASWVFERGLHFISHLMIG